jgi:hypothetical protein
MVSFLIFLVIVCLVATIVCIVIDYLCGLVPLGHPIPLLLKLVVVLIAVLAIFNHGIPYVGRLTG